jgi:hypothetical protein
MRLRIVNADALLIADLNLLNVEKKRKIPPPVQANRAFSLL